jgi:hypothetical protein
MWVALPAIVAVGAIVVIIFLERARRRDRLAAARWAMISRVSAVLAEILHADTTLEDVARLLVPQFAGARSTLSKRPASGAQPSSTRTPISNAGCARGSPKFPLSSMRRLVPRR